MVVNVTPKVMDQNSRGPVARNGLSWDCPKFRPFSMVGQKDITTSSVFNLDVISTISVTDIRSYSVNIILLPMAGPKCSGNRSCTISGVKKPCISKMLNILESKNTWLP